MRTSLDKLNMIENFLSGQLSPEGRVLFDAQLVLDKDLSDDLSAQRGAYKIIRAYSRQSLKSELEILHTELQRDSKLKSFWQNIYKIFQGN
jgi:hypothetical protein